ncbi:MAG: DUF4198 domain-containing protein [Thermoanaerobaculia bacterium]
MTRRFVSILFCLTASAALAHDTWILPASGPVRPGAPVSFDMTSGMAFPAPDHAIAADRLAAASFRLGGKTSDISNRAAGAHALKLTATLGEDGIAAVWAESKPRFIELTPKQVDEYLEEIGAADTVGREWKALGAGAKWRENYTKHVKTFVRVGEPGQDSSWKEPVGMAFEIVPEQDPTALSSGDRLTVQLLKDGKPLPDFPVGLVAAKAKDGSIQKTDTQGRVSLQLDRPGWWLLRATQIERSSKPELDWESHFTTLTVQTGPKK